jgi:hypothetical protein
MADRRNRGQSEVVGILFLVGIVTISFTTAGVFMMSNMTQQATNDDPRLDCEIEYVDDTVTVTHRGGESVRTDQLDTILRNASSQSQSLFEVTDGNGNSQFEPGESATFGSVSEDTDVLVVTDRAIVCQETVEPASDEDDDGDGDDGGEGNDGQKDDEGKQGSKEDDGEEEEGEDNDDDGDEKEGEEEDQEDDDDDGEGDD